jgi:hypothetical protein
VNYQKAPEHKFPIPFDDCWASVEWVIENAKTFNEINEVYKHLPYDDETQKLARIKIIDLYFKT